MIIPVSWQTEKTGDQVITGWVVELVYDECAAEVWACVVVEGTGRMEQHLLESLFADEGWQNAQRIRRQDSRSLAKYVK